MPRRARTVVGGYVYHILNRANDRHRLFTTEHDFAAFERVLDEAQSRVQLRILGYVIMPNHWHFVVWPRPEEDTAVSAFFGWLSLTHSQRWRAYHGNSGAGHVYQGRFKSFPIAGDEHLLTVLRYVERNPLRAKLVSRAESWRWGSLHQRVTGRSEPLRRLVPSPVPLGEDWVEQVNRPQTEAELAALCLCVSRGQPFGPLQWCANVTRELGLEKTMRSQNRPRQT